MRVPLVALVLAATLMTAPGARAQVADAPLGTIPGPSGCIGLPNRPSCTQGRGTTEIGALAAAPGGSTLYATALSSGALLDLARAPAGGLTERGCIADDGSGQGCADGSALRGADRVGLSPDGSSIYVAGTGRLAWFDRDPSSGELEERGCLEVRPPPGSVCAKDELLPDEPGFVGVSPDGRNLYLLGDGTMLVFARDATGAPVRTGCMSADGSGGTCAPLTRLLGATAAAFAPDGRQVYVVAGGLVLVLARDADSGTLTLASCAPAGVGRRGGCGATAGNAGPWVGVAPDGATLFAESSDDQGALLEFGRDPADGALHSAGCLSATGRGPCIRAPVVVRPAAFAFEPDSSRRMVALTWYGDRATIVSLATRPGAPLPHVLSCTSGGEDQTRCAFASELADDAQAKGLAVTGGDQVYAALGLGGLVGFAPGMGIHGGPLRLDARRRGNLRITCPAASPARCRGVLSITRADLHDARVYTHTRFSIAAGSSALIGVGLSRRALREIEGSFYSGHARASVAWHGHVSTRRTLVVSR